VVVEGTGGWADRLRGALIDGAYLDERRSVAIALVADPEAAAKLALERGREPLSAAARRARGVVAEI
jgi:hypothetical protein